MLRILVADDEKVTRKGIVTMLQRDIKEDVEFIEASNGQEALDICRNQLIHLVITDINMPLCSGLEFVSKLRESDSEMTVLILTGYENFSYAKEAVRLGVKEYITKPAEREEFLGIVEKQLAEIQKKKMSAQERYLTMRRQKALVRDLEEETVLELISGKPQELTLKRWNELRILPKSTCYETILIDYEVENGEEELQKFTVKNISDEILGEKLSCSFYGIHIADGRLAYLLSFPSVKDRTDLHRVFTDLVFTLERYCRIRTVAAAGEAVYREEDIYRSYAGGTLAADSKVYGDYRRFLDAVEIPEGTAPDEKEAAGAGITFFETCMKQSRTLADTSAMRKSYETLRARLENPAEQLPFSEIWSPLSRHAEVARMLQILEAERSEPQASDTSRLVEEIQKFTLDHVTEDIDLSYIAERFSRTPGYIGSLFRKYTGRGFNDFITDERMRLAAKMLEDPSVSIQDTAEKCGYYNAKYFSVVFKKVMGMSPKTYQKSTSAGGGR